MSRPDLVAMPAVKAPLAVTAATFLTTPRAPIEPFAATADGRTILLAREGTLLVAGPSGTGKSLVAAFDLAGRLASPGTSDWLGLTISGGRRVLLLPFEGSDEDTAERVAQLVPADAHDRFIVVDRWRGADLPRASPTGNAALAHLLREHAIDVLVIDTAAAFFGGAYDISKGVPEEAHADIEDLRARSGRRFACIVIAHTRKADRGGARVDELEEISGTFPRKVDAAIVIRRDGDEGSRRRRIAFAKVRRGPQPRALIAAFPEDPDARPRLTVVAEAGRPISDGTDARSIADWIARHPEPVAAALVRVHFDLSETTLRNRVEALRSLGVERHRRPGAGNSQAYGTAEQWRRLAFGIDGESS